MRRIAIQVVGCQRCSWGRFSYICRKPIVYNTKRCKFDYAISHAMLIATRCALHFYGSKRRSLPKFNSLKVNPRDAITL